MAVVSPGSTAVDSAPVRSGGRPRAGQAEAARMSPGEVLQEQALRADRGPVASPSRPVPRPLLPAARPLASAAAAWALSPAAAPWRGDLVRAGLAPAAVLAASLAPGRGLPVTVLLVAGAYLLLVLAAALGRLDDGVRVPPALLLGLDALHLLWAAHVTSGLGGPVPVVAATAAVCLLLRLVLLPPLPPARTPGRAAAATAVPLVLAATVSAPRPAPRRCPGCPHRGADRAQRERLEVARAEA